MGEARQVAERMYQSFGAGDLETAMGCFADSCVSVTPGGSFNNVQHEAFARAFKDALPNASMEIVRAVESGTEVFISGRFKGTHQGDLVSPQGTIPASGNTLDMPFADYFRVEDGKIVEHEVIWDQMGMMAQLGAMPPG
ncbi:MAG: ester cyclase [Acidimicrobiia bacterium]